MTSSLKPKEQFKKAFYGIIKPKVSGSRSSHWELLLY